MLNKPIVGILFFFFHPLFKCKKDYSYLQGFYIYLNLLNSKLILKKILYFINYKEKNNHSELNNFNHMKKYRLISFYSNTEAWCSFINISTIVWGNKFLSVVVLKACFVYIFHLHEKILYFYVTSKYPDKYISVGNHFQHKNQMDTYTVTHLWPVSCRAIFQNGRLFYLRCS